MISAAPDVTELRARVYRVPTDRPEADGTYAWDCTTLVLVEAAASSGQHGLGFSYCASAAAAVVRDMLAPIVVGTGTNDVASTWSRMVAAVRNVGRQGIAATAISAVDVALWDLAARVLDRPLCLLLGARRERVPIYGSGGFTSYTEAELTAQLGGRVARGIPREDEDRHGLGLTAGSGRASRANGT